MNCKILRIFRIKYLNKCKKNNEICKIREKVQYKNYKYEDKGK